MCAVVGKGEVRRGFGTETWQKVLLGKKKEKKKWIKTII